MAIIRRVGAKKGNLGKNPLLTKRAIVAALPTATHEDMERIRMLERHLLGQKRRVETNKRPLTHEEVETFQMLARHLDKVRKTPNGKTLSKAEWIRRANKELSAEKKAIREGKKPKKRVYNEEDRKAWFEEAGIPPF